MKISLEVLKVATLPKKKPWTSIKFLSEDAEDLLLLGRKNASIFHLASGKIKKKTPKIENCFKNSALYTNTKDGNHLVILLFTGTILVWKYQVDFVWTIDQLPFCVSPPKKKLKNLIFASNNIESVLVILHTHEIYLWQRDGVEFNTKNPMLNGKWTQIEKSPGIPFQLTDEATADAIFMNNSAWESAVICTLVFVCENEISFTTLQICWNKSRRLKINWFNWLSNYKNLNLKAVDKRAFVARFANDEPLLAISVNQTRASNAYLIFTNPSLESVKFTNLPANDAGYSNRYQRITDLVWLPNNTCLVCLHSNGSFCILSRLGHPIHIGVEGYHLDSSNTFYVSLSSKNRDSHISDPAENSDSTATDSNSNPKQRYSITTHPKHPAMFYSDGSSIISLSMPPAIQNEIRLIEHLLTTNSHIPARITNPKDKTKFKLTTLGSEDSSTRSDNIPEQEFASVRRMSHISNVTAPITDLLASFGLLASTRMPWDEKMELMSVDTARKLNTILEDLFIYSVGVDKNWKFPVGIIDSIILKCFNTLRFDVRHNLMATGLKFLTTVTDLLINNVRTITGKQRMPYLNCVYEIMANSEQLVNDIYGWTCKSDAQTPFSYQTCQLITTSFENKELDCGFQHRLKLKWKELYKVLLQCFSQIQRKNDENDEKKCKELLCKIQLKLQISRCGFKRRKKKHVPEGVYSFLNGNYHSAILSWTLEMDQLLSRKNLHEKGTKRLEEILHCILHGLLITNDLVTVFKLIQKLLKFLQFESSFKHISAINSILLTFARLLASYLTNCSPKIAKCSSFTLKSAKNSDIFQLISRESIRSAVTSNNLSNFWSAETTCALYIFVGAFAEAAIFADVMGDWKSTFLLAVAHSKIEVSAKMHPDIPNNLKCCELMVKMLKQIIEAKNEVVDTALSRTVTHTLRDHITASVLCDINVVPVLLNHFTDQLKHLLRQLPLEVPKEFYLPSPPIFCPQDQMTLSTSDAKIETKIRNDLSNLIHSFMNLLTACNTLLPTAYKYAKDLQSSTLAHSFADYDHIIMPEQDETLGQMYTAFRDICCVIWLLHSRDKFQIEWRKFWRISSEMKFSQPKCDAHCLTALIWVKRMKPFTDLMQWSVEFHQVVLTLAREATPSTQIIDVFASLVPDVSALPLECESRAKLLLKEWETNKVDKKTPKTMVDYYRDCCENIGIIGEKMFESELGVHSKPFETDDDFLNCVCLFYDVAIHKRMEETTNLTYNVPLVVSYAEKVKKVEFSKYRHIPEACEAKEIPRNRDLDKLDIKCRNPRKGFFHTSSLLDLTQSNIRVIPKRSRSLETFKSKDKKMASNLHKKPHPSKIPVRSILNELQSISKWRKVEAIDKTPFLDHLALWLVKWKGRNHAIKTLNCDKEIQPQIHIDMSVDQILASISRLELYSKNPPRQNEKTSIGVRKPPKSTERLPEESNGATTEKKSEENLIFYARDLASVTLPNSDKFEDTHIHPTGLDSPKQSQTVSGLCLVKHSTNSGQIQPKLIPSNQIFDVTSSSDSVTSSLEEDDDTLNDMSFPNSLPDPPPRTVRFSEPHPPPLPNPCIPKFLRLVAEKENFQTKSTDPRLRGGGCYGQMQFPLLRAPAIQNFNVGAPPCLSHWGLPLLRLPQKYSTNQAQQSSPPCHVCVDVNPCNQNLYVQNMLRSYWINVKQNRCQQMVDYSLNRNLVGHQTMAAVEPQSVDQMRLLNGKYSSSEDNIHTKYNKHGLSNLPELTEDTSDISTHLEDRYRQILQSDSSCQQIIHSANACSPTRIHKRNKPQPKTLSRATSPIRMPTKMVTRTTSPEKMVTRTTSPEKIVTRTTSPEKMVTRTTSPVKIVTRTASPVKMVTRTTSPYKMLLNKTTSPIMTSSDERTYSPPISPQRTFSPSCSPRRVCGPPLSPQRTFSPPCSPRRACSPLSSPERVSSPRHSPLRVSSPRHSPLRVSSPRHSPLRVCNPRSTPIRVPSPPNSPKRPFSPRAKASSVAKSKSLSSSKMKSTYYTGRSRSPSPTRRKHLVHSCKSSLYSPSYEEICSPPKSPKTSFSNLSSYPQTVIEEDQYLCSILDKKSSLDCYAEIDDKLKRKSDTQPRTIETQVDSDIFPPQPPKEQRLPFQDIKHGLLDVVNEFAETHHHVINQLEEVRELMKEMNRQDKDRAIQQTDQNIPPSETNQIVLSQLQEVHDFMKEMRQNDKNCRAIDTIQTSPPSDGACHFSPLQNGRKSLQNEMYQPDESRQQQEESSEQSQCLDVPKASFENRKSRRQTCQIPSPPNVPSEHSSCTAPLYGKKYTDTKHNCHPIRKQPIPGLEGYDRAEESPSRERKCKIRKETNPYHNYSPHNSCIPWEPPSADLYGRIPSDSPKRVIQTDSNRRKIEKCQSPPSVSGQRPTISKYYNYVGEKTSENCLSQRPWALKSTANHRCLKVQNVNNSIIAEESRKICCDNTYCVTKTFSPTHYGKTSTSTKQTMQTRPLITSPYCAYLQCASPLTCPQTSTCAEYVRKQRISPRPKSSRINPFLIENIAEMDEDKENVVQICDKNWHSTSAIPPSADKCIQRNLRSWSHHLSNKTVERETSGADEGRTDSAKADIVKPENDEFINIQGVKNYDSGIDVEDEKKSILDFHIPDIAEDVTMIFELDEVVLINEVQEDNNQTLSYEVDDFEEKDKSQTPQVKARDSLHLKLKTIKEQCDLMDAISNELQIDFEDSKQLLNSVGQLADSNMFQPSPRNHQIYRSPRLTLNLNPNAQLVVHLPKSKPNLSYNSYAHEYTRIHSCHARDYSPAHSCQARNYSPDYSCQSKDYSPVHSCQSKDYSPLHNYQSRCFTPINSCPSKQTTSLSSDTIEHFPSPATSKNVASVHSSVHSKECQHNMHVKMRMQDACELMKELLSSDTNVASSGTEQLALAENAKPKEMKQILTKMEETLKKDLSKMGIYKAPYLQANSWATNSNDSAQLYNTVKEDGRSRDAASSSQNGQYGQYGQFGQHDGDMTKPTVHPLRDLSKTKKLSDRSAKNLKFNDVLVSKEQQLGNTMKSRDPQLGDMPKSRDPQLIEVSKSRDPQLDDVSKSKDLKLSDTSKSKDPQVGDTSKSRNLQLDDMSKSRDLKMGDTSKSKDRKLSDTSKSKDLQMNDKSKLKDWQLNGMSKSKDPQFGDNSKSKDPQFGDNSKSKDPQFGDKSKQKGPQLGDTSKSKDPQLGNASKSKDPQLGDTSKSKDPQLGNASKSKDQQLDDTSKSKNLQLNLKSKPKYQQARTNNIPKPNTRVPRVSRVNDKPVSNLQHLLSHSHLDTEIMHGASHLSELTKSRKHSAPKTKISHPSIASMATIQRPSVSQKKISSVSTTQPDKSNKMADKSGQPEKFGKKKSRRKLRLAKKGSFERNSFHPLEPKTRIKWLHQPLPVLVRSNRTQFLREQEMLKTKATSGAVHPKVGVVDLVDSADNMDLQEDDAPLQSESERFSISTTSSPSTWNVPRDVREIIYGGNNDSN